MDSHRIFEQLKGAAPVVPTRLPQRFGIYALWDHSAQIRYIGCTPKATEGFNTRVASKHVTGSEGRSHKFSHAYCTGRMWRYCKKLHPAVAGEQQHDGDAELAKKLRTLFIRRFCRVSFVEVPQTSGNYFGYLTGLEREIQAGAPPSMRLWEGVRFVPNEEPVSLVDIVLAENPSLKDAANRQNALYAKHVKRNEV